MLITAGLIALVLGCIGIVIGSTKTIKAKYGNKVIYGSGGVQVLALIMLLTGVLWH